jgi:hypothetical protein
MTMGMTIQAAAAKIVPTKTIPTDTLTHRLQR